MEFETMEVDWAEDVEQELYQLPRDDEDSRALTDSNHLSDTNVPSSEHLYDHVPESHDGLPAEEALSDTTLPPSVDTEKPIMINDVGFILVSTPDELGACIDALTGTNLLFIDCEGLQLGAHGGSLSLINIAQQNGDVWVVDALALGREALGPLFAILVDKNVAKVMFDARMDWSEHLHGYGVEIKGVLDMQLADILSRAKRGEVERQQMWRLRPFIHPADLNGCWKQYTRIHRLNGLVKCCFEHKLQIQPRKEAYHDFWNERPMRENMVKAAARDVQYIRSLWWHFVERNWINVDELAAASQRYVESVRAGRPNHDDVYRCNGLLPQGVIGIEKDHASYTLRCSLCDRDHSPHSFLRAAFRRQADRRYCATCRAIWIRGKRNAERANLREGERQPDIKKWLDMWEQSPPVTRRLREGARAPAGDTRERVTRWDDRQAGRGWVGRQSADRGPKRVRRPTSSDIAHRGRR